MTTCIVLGGADCLWDDLQAFWALHADDPAPGNVIAPEKPWQGVVACNDAGTVWPGELDAWASIHPQYFKMKKWRATRADNGYPEAKVHYGIPESFQSGSPNLDQITPDIVESSFVFPGGEGVAGSSGLYAIKIALVNLAFDNVVLCGIPLTKTPHFFDQVPWRFAPNYRERFVSVPQKYRKRIRSMSGWTKDYFGHPSLQEK